MRIYPNLDPDLVGQILRAVAEDEDTVRRLVCDIRPAAEPVGDYVDDYDERRRVLAELRELCREHHTTPYAAVMGFFMVAPLGPVRVLLEQCRVAPRPFFWLNSVSWSAAEAVKTFAPGFTPPKPPQAVVSDQDWLDNFPADEPTYEPDMAVQKALTRDRATCPFTSTPSPAVALLAPPAQPSPSLSILHTLWGEAAASAWSRAADAARAPGAPPRNHLCLNHQLRHWFDAARFALKPLRRGPAVNNSNDDGQAAGYEVVLQWHWLRPSRFAPRMGIEADVPEGEVLEMAGVDEGGKVWGGEREGVLRGSGVPIRTGQTFALWAEREEDLPSWELLEMRWVLQRVAAICGAAEEGAREGVF